MSDFNRKYRPKKWGRFIGNSSAVEALRKSIGDVQFFLIYGLRGCGKTTLARLIGRDLNVSKIDLWEIDAASNRGIEYIRQMKRTVHSKPFRDWKLYIIDECHGLTSDAEQALLKILEEPPPHVCFVFCTTELNKVAVTIKSRAMKFEVKPLAHKEVLELLKRVCRKEKLKIDREVLNEIAGSSEGVPREALILLQQVKGLDTEEALSMIKEVREEDVRIICRALLRSKNERNWKDIREVLKANEDDPEKVRRAFLSYFSKVLLDNPSPRAALLAEVFMEDVFSSGKAGLITLVAKAHLL